MALRVAVGPFLRIFGVGLWLGMGKPPTAGLAQFFLFYVGSSWWFMVFQLRSRTFCRWASMFLPSQGSREQKSQAHQLVPVGFFWAAFCWSSAFGVSFGAFVRHFLFTRWRQGKRPVEFAR